MSPGSLGIAYRRLYGFNFLGRELVDFVISSSEDIEQLVDEAHFVLTCGLQIR